MQCPGDKVGQALSEWRTLGLESTPLTPTSACFRIELEGPLLQEANIQVGLGFAT